MSHEDLRAGVEEGTDNTNALASIIETGDIEEVSMILGTRERIRQAGVIRPGIMVPMKGCTKAQLDLYKRLLDEGHSFKHIGDEMLKIAPADWKKKTCLFPSNSDYFTIRDEDFKRPADAEYIRSHYADTDGKVRRIPCWLPMSDIEKAVPHNFRAFSAGGLRCVSFYEQGRIKFRYLPKGFQGSPKAEDWLVLDTDDEDKASNACGIDVKFGGMYRVYVPGCRGAGEIICPTQSWYGLGESVSVLKRVRSILGRFDGLFNGDSFFELCKVQQEVKAPGGKRQMQWIVTLELAVDMIELARYAEPMAVAARGAQAMSLLTGSRPATPSPTAPAVGFHSTLGGVVVPESGTVALHVGGSGAGDPPLVSDRHAGAIKALVDLVAPFGLFQADMETLFAAEHRGVEISEADIAEVESFFKMVRLELHRRSADFCADVVSLRNPEGGQ